jgi:hypothetical protein
MSTNGTNVNVPLFSSGAMFTPPEVTTVTTNAPSASSMKYEPPATEDATNSVPVDVNSAESAESTESAENAESVESAENTEEGQLGGSASAALAALPVETDPFWRQALLDAVADVRVEKAYNDTFAPSASGASASGALPVLPSTNPLFALTQTNPPGITPAILASLGFSMPTNLAASAASPLTLTRAVNPTLYDMVVATPNPAVWEPVLKSYNPPFLYPTDLPLASGAAAPLTGKDKWKADNRAKYVIAAPTDEQIILRDGMTGEQTAAVIFNFNLRQYIDPKARALGTAERANPINFNRVAWVTTNIPVTDMVVFDNDNAGLYKRDAANVSSLDILKRIVLMEARILHGFGAAPAATPAVVTPGAPAPVAPVAATGVPSSSAMSAPIIAAIQGIVAPNSALMSLVNKVGSAVTKVGKQVASTATAVSELTTGVQSIAQGMGSGNAAEGGGRKSRRIRRA